MKTSALVMTTTDTPHIQVRLSRTNPVDVSGRVRVAFRIHDGRRFGISLSADDARQMAESLLFALSQHDKFLSSDLGGSHVPQD